MLALVTDSTCGLTRVEADELGVTVAFGEDMLPVSAEFTLSGESAAVCEIKEFSISHGT